MKRIENMLNEELGASFWISLLEVYPAGAVTWAVKVRYTLGSRKN
jgi:hypothetical protein